MSLILNRRKTKQISTRSSRTAGLFTGLPSRLNISRIATSPKERRKLAVSHFDRARNLRRQKMPYRQYTKCYSHVRIGRQTFQQE